ncbi:hypothetical protein VCUG_01485 [Vavraia culicis subsp. floridensis]|uniref:Chromatin assembly factor 1 subunit A dimerization domain-containing protein n=1 Tax=Vavraia culicis (isolate floridensis) TaxID=948595 RepID=L2GVB9_VAVCU|nr:uncharacterized protein VCUG_01485 [Vavraia culicis subsp. floridensis]ELA47040.1 hypothetical protein VCUG_01485 [Vavraia culicis subsp. floridensis]
MEFHPVTLEILKNYKISSETDINLELLTLIIDSKTFLDINFVYRYIFTYKKNAKRRTTTMRRLKEWIKTYFEYCVYKYVDSRILCVEKMSVSSSFVLPEHTCALLQLKDDCDIKLQCITKRTLRLIFVNREKTKKQLLSQPVDDYKGPCPSTPADDEQGSDCRTTKQNSSKQHSNKEKEINLHDKGDKRREGLTQNTKCSIDQNNQENDEPGTKIRKTRRTSTSTKKDAEITCKEKFEDKNGFDGGDGGVADRSAKRTKILGVHSLSNYIKKEKLVEKKDRNSSRFVPINFPPNTLIFQIGLGVKSTRKYETNRKLTYIKFHDTIRPSIHAFYTKYRTNNSVKRIPFVLNYDEDSDLLWNDDESGESINYATDSEDNMVEEDSFECSWIEEGDEHSTKRADLSFRMTLPNMKISFLKDKSKYKFHD